MTALIIAGFVILVVLVAEACLIIPDKLPWIRKRTKK